MSLSPSSLFGGLKLTSNRSSLCYSLPSIRQTVSASSPTPSLKTRLRHGEKLKGMLLFSSSPNMAEIASLVGYGFIVVDLEHGPADYSTALGCIRATEVFGCKTVIRVLEISATCAKRALDLGLDGIMFPKVEMGKAARKRSLSTLTRLMATGDVLTHSSETRSSDLTRATWKITVITSS